MSTIHRLEPKIFHTTFGRNEPAFHIASGDTIVAETRDARGQDKHGAPLPDSMKPRADGFEYSPNNPLVGPIYVEGAEPGDALAVHIEKIELNRPSAWSSHSPNFGSLTGEQYSRRLLLNDPLPRLLFHWSLDLERRIGVLELTESRITRFELPLHPFIGSIGVAPRYGRVETALTPGEYGGNMDCVETRAGTTIYFPVWARGAYLSFGDIHAAQGDGEVCGSALETTAEVTLRVEVKKQWAIDWPRLEDADFLMTTGSLHSLLDAVRVAQIEMLNWLMNDYGFAKWESWQVISQASTMRIGNIVDPNYTVVVKFPKALLAVPPH
ncbi:MAG: acetamidase/formamidase family protein [Chloroflexi bacterium]|nr:acetamidase/formamidase family protein [Chloroflexota bacterium]